MMFLQKMCTIIEDSDQSVPAMQSGQTFCEQRFFQAGHYRPAGETTLKCCFAGRPIVAQYHMLAG